METLRAEAFKTFEKCFLEVINHSGGQITTGTASLIAVRMTTGLFRPIYAQLDPMRLGDYQRSMLVAERYGLRLNATSDNLNQKEDALAKLIAGYPSHEFAIDRKEAESLFRRVRTPTEKEAALARLLESDAWAQISADPAHVKCLSEKPQTVTDKETAHDKPGISDRVAPPPAGKEGRGAASPGESGGGTRQRRERQASATGGNGVPSRPGPR